MNITQGILHSLEEGRSRILTRLIPLAVTLLVVFLLYNFETYHGLNDAQSMDNAQLARQIVQGHGYTTKFIRPAALAQLSAYAKEKNAGQSVDFFPAAQFPAGTARTLPDTYNPPGYPYLLAGWFELMRPNFNETPQAISLGHIYSPERSIPWLNEIFLFLTAGMLFFWSWRLFDVRVAWMTTLAFLLSDVVWQYSLTALPTSFLMFLITLAILVAMEIFTVGEAAFESLDASFMPAWVWIAVLGILVGVIALTKLLLLVFLVPLAVFLLLMPRSNFWLVPVLAIIAIGMTVPWFLHMTEISGSPLGSNAPLLHYGSDSYEGNQIYCVLAPPDYNQLFKDASRKEVEGFVWHLQHAWELLGSNPLILLFAAAVLHQFKQARVRALYWLTVGTAVSFVLANNLCVSNPAPGSSWNVLILLFPAMLMIGSAYFFILVDRLDFQLWLLNNIVAITALVLVAIPMVNTLRQNTGFFNYPPYSPPSISQLGLVVHNDVWVTTDMPWAMAWYGNHASLWLPDTVHDFEDIYDNYCGSGLLLLTPVLLSQPATTLTSGEYKDWFSFVSGYNPPVHFPLGGRIPLHTGGPEYILWANPAEQ